MLAFLLNRAEIILLVLGIGVALALFGTYWLMPDEASTEAHERALPAAAAAGGFAEAAPGTLAVYSFPNGASVRLGAEVVGTTPLHLEGLASRQYRLTVESDSYPPRDTLVTLAPGRTTSVALFLDSLPPDAAQTAAEALPPASEPPAYAAYTPPPEPEYRPPPPPETRPAPTPRTGTLAVVVRPWGTILIDDAVRARETDVRYETTLPVGRHRVRAVHPSLGSREVEVTIRPGTPAHVEFDLNQRASGG